MQEKNIFIGQSTEVFIFSSSHVRLLLEVGILSIKCSKTLYFRKSAVKLISFDLKHAKFIRGNVFSIRCNRLLCFSKERRSAYFCPKGGVLSSIYDLDSIYNGN